MIRLETEIEEEQAIILQWHAYAAIQEKEEEEKAEGGNCVLFTGDEISLRCHFCI